MTIYTNQNKQKFIIDTLFQTGTNRFSLRVDIYEYPFCKQNFGDEPKLESFFQGGFELTDHFFERIKETVQNKYNFEINILF